MEIIKLININKTYKKDNKTIEILKNINITFETNKFYAITGLSGAGKSTLIKILGLMDKADQGEYILNNKNVEKLNDIESSKIRMSEIGFVFQDFYLDEYASAKENVILPMLINKEIDKSEREIKALDALEKLNLLERQNHLPKELSGGEQQRVCLARALANNPTIILADEPTGNLDEKNEKEIFKYLKQLAKTGKCIIVVSHSKEIKKYADEVLTIKDGKVTKQ